MGEEMILQNAECKMQNLKNGVHCTGIRVNRQK